MKNSKSLFFLVCIAIFISGCRSVIDGYIPRGIRKKIALVPVLYSEKAPYFLYDFEEDSVSNSIDDIQEPIAEVKKELPPVEAVNPEESLTEFDKFEKSVGDYWVYYDERLLSKCLQLDSSIAKGISDYDEFYNNQMRWEKFKNATDQASVDSLKRYDFLLLNHEKKNFETLSNVVIAKREKLYSAYQLSIKDCGNSNDLQYINDRIKAIENSDSLSATSSNFQKSKFPERLWFKKNWEYIGLLDLFNANCADLKSKSAVVAPDTKVPVADEKPKVIVDQKPELENPRTEVKQEVAVAPIKPKAVQIAPELNTFKITESNSAPLVIDDYNYPEGNVYSIQIGAFRGKVDEVFYQKFSPVLKEALKDGLNRYTVGVFNNPILAKKALEEVRALGYNDAFIVVHIDGKRRIYQGD